MDTAPDIEGNQMKKISIIFVLVFLIQNFGPVLRAEDQTLKFEQPLLITSAGQSAEVQLANVLAKRAGLTATLTKLATEKDIENVKTVVLVLGISLKGLGAAGLDMTQEKERVIALLEAAKSGSTPVLCLHLGGEARRGQISDELIELCLPYAAAVLLVKSGNGDGFFTKLCREKNISLIEVERTVDAITPLQNLFK